MRNPWPKRMVQNCGGGQAAQMLQPGPPSAQERKDLDAMSLVTQALTNGRDVRANVTAWSQQQRNQDQRQALGQLQGIRGQGLHPDGSLTVSSQLGNQIHQNLWDLTPGMAMDDQQQWGALASNGLR